MRKLIDRNRKKWRQVELDILRQSADLGGDYIQVKLAEELNYFRSFRAIKNKANELAIKLRERPSRPDMWSDDENHAIQSLASQGAHVIAEYIELCFNNKRTARAVRQQAYSLGVKLKKVWQPMVTTLEGETISRAEFMRRNKMQLDQFQDPAIRQSIKLKAKLEEKIREELCKVMTEDEYRKFMRTQNRKYK